mmetsp:Transcript_2940/g.5811  ORF Transcript_2940/g.5811 Transcript_2940/m.5811 type:complete len:576 (-) Transcript_2940:129-1856(-)|eukprot:scaffold1581_cov169-Amphora_coffeaeformis.AAC.37
MSQSATESPHSARGALSSSQPHSLTMQSPCIESPPTLKPPVSVVFVDMPGAMRRSTIQGTTSPLQSPPPARSNTSLFGSTTAATSGTSPNSGFFRLQPRHKLKGTISPQGTINSSQSRKRRVGTLTDDNTQPSLDLKTGNPIFEWSSGWKAPHSKEGTPEESPGSTDGNALDLQGLSLKSPLRPSPPRPPKGREGESQISLMFSSFSRFSQSSDCSLRKNMTSSIDGTEESKSTEGRRSPAVSSVKSSPKLIPLKVLLHNDPNSPLSSRPPLRSTPASFKNHPGEGRPAAGASLPPQIFMSAHSPQGSLSPIHDPDAIDPPPKTRRTHHFDSPGSRKSTPRRSPRIPKISLTPRSDGPSTSLYTEGFPQFPSPPQGLQADEENMSESHMILQRAYEQNMVIGSPERTNTYASRPEFFIPVPDWGESQTTWLNPTEADRFAGMFSENGSFSEDSQDVDFVLASPAVIAEESTAQANAKYRRLHLAADSTGHLSSTSLLGMNFIQSNTCLAAMENKPSGSSFLSLSRFSGSCGQLRRNESQTSVGLTLDYSQPDSSERDLVTPPPSQSQPKDPPHHH